MQEKHKVELVLWVEGEDPERAELIAERLCQQITAKLPKGIWLSKKPSVGAESSASSVDGDR